MANKEVISLFKKYKVPTIVKNDKLLIHIEDMATNICKINNPKLYRNKIKNKTKLNKLWYYELDRAINNISRSRSNIAKKFMEKYNLIIKDESDDESSDFDSESDNESDDETDNSIVDLYKNIYQYQGNKVMLFRIDNDIWFRGKDIANILKYIDTEQSIQKHVDCDNKVSFNFIKQKLPFEKTGSCNMHPSTIFINQIGLFSLVMRSKMKDAIKFQKWICNDLLPKIFNYGCYSLKTDDLSKFNFYSKNLISEYKDKNVIYLAYIGKHNQQDMLKFGISSDFPRRELIEHRKTFAIFNVLYIEEAELSSHIENKLKLEFKARNMLQNIKINNKMQKEVVALNAINGVESCINIIKQLVSNNKPASIKLLEERNKNLQKENDQLRKTIKDKEQIICLLKKS